jgi:hypothetical protein
MNDRTRYGTDHRKISVDYYNEIRSMSEAGRKYVADKLGALFCENIRIPSTSINPPGQASDPDVEADSGLLLFDDSVTELVFAIIQMPYRTAKDSSIHPHVHWEKTTSAAGDVAWRIRYKNAPVGAVRDAAWTDLGIITTTAEETPDVDTADHQLVTGFPKIDLTGTDVEHSVLFEFSRVGGDASDTYGADARLIAFDIHYEVDSFGGYREGQKQTF